MAVEYELPGTHLAVWRNRLLTVPFGFQDVYLICYDIDENNAVRELSRLNKNPHENDIVRSTPEYYKEGGPKRYKGRRAISMQLKDIVVI